MVENGLSSKVVKLDMDFILDNFDKKFLWGKEWTIFKYGEMEVRFYIHSIDVYSDNVWFKVELYQDGIFKFSEMFFLSYDKEHRNLKVIDKKIAGEVVSLFRSYDLQLVKETQEYKTALGLEKQMQDVAEKKANELLDELNITNEDIREAYVSNERYKAQTSEFSSKVIEELKYTKAPEYLLGFMMFSDYHERAINEVRNKVANVDDLMETINEKLEEIKTGEFYDSIDLEEIKNESE